MSYHLFTEATIICAFLIVGHGTGRVFFFIQPCDNKVRIKPKAKRKLNSMLGLTRREFSAQETLAMKETMNITLPST